MPKGDRNRRVFMAKAVARRYLEKMAAPEYRLRVFHTSEVSNFPDLLRSFRDGQTRIGGIEPIRDLGIQEEFDSISIWTSNREALLRLRDWLEERNVETSGIW